MRITTCLFLVSLVSCKRDDDFFRLRTPPVAYADGGGATAKSGSAATDESFDRDLAETVGKPKPPAPTRAAQDKASAPAVKSDPVAKAEPAVRSDHAEKPKPAKKKNRWPQYGREMGPELMDYPQFEYKDSWDYGVVRVDYAMNGRSLIWVLHRCDSRDGCDGKPGSGANWADIGWYQQN